MAPKLRYKLSKKQSKLCKGIKVVLTPTLRFHLKYLKCPIKFQYFIGITKKNFRYFIFVQLTTADIALVSLVIYRKAIAAQPIN